MAPKADPTAWQLTAAARSFFSDGAKFHYDLQRGEMRVSPIIKWFAEDFGRTEPERFRYLAQFMPDANVARLAASGRARVSYLDYDWNLNITPRRVTERNPAAERFPETYSSSNCQGGTCRPCQGAQCHGGG